MLSSTQWPAATDSPDIRDQLRELQIDTLGLFLALTAAGYLTWHLATTVIWLPNQRVSVEHVTQASLVAAVIIPILMAARALLSRPTLASIIFVGGMLVSVSWAIYVFDSGDPAAFYAIVALAAAFVIGPGTGALALVATIGLMGLLSAARPSTIGPTEVWQVVAYSTFSIVGVWAVRRHLFLALNWYVESYARSESQMRSAQDHRAQLVQAWQQLDIAYVQLEQVNQELDRARRAADEARRLKVEFATSVSHELRTPLNLIIGFSEMMVVNPRTYGVALPPSYHGDAEAIYRNACHLSSLVDDILDLSKIDAHRMGLQREPIRVDQVVEEATAAVGSMFLDKGLALVAQLPPDLPVLHADRIRIRQVLINLLNNAARFTSRGGVTVGGAADEHEVVVWVTDTGTGIPPADLPHVFDEFYQVGGANWRRSTGLGLAICKRFVELHGGNMWVESEPGKGSTFYFSLPTIANVVAASPLEGWETWARGPTGPQERRAVAVLGDDREVAGVFGRYLDGYEVIGAPNLAAIRGSAEQRPVQAVLVSTPEARSEALREIRDGGGLPDVPVVFAPIRGSRAIGRELGVVQFLTKPVTGQQIREVLSTLGTGGRRILIVDDEPEMVRLLSRLVRSEPYGDERHVVSEARDGEQALEMMRADPPDLVLLDLLMPRLDGYGVLDQMRGDAWLRRLPVVLITAKGADESMTASELAVTRARGLSIGEVMKSCQAILSSILDGQPGHSAPGRSGEPAA